MATMELKKEGDVFVLSLINGARANTITDDVIAEYNAVLDELEGCHLNGGIQFLEGSVFHYRCTSRQ